MLIHPAHKEPLGRVFIEAGACGKPVIGVRSGGVPELVRDGVNGFLAEEEDFEGFVDIIRYIVSNPAIGRGLGAGGLSYVRERFSVERYAKAITEILESSLPAA